MNEEKFVVVRVQSGSKSNSEEIRRYVSAFDADSNFSKNKEDAVLFNEFQAKSVKAILEVVENAYRPERIFSVHYAVEEISV